MSETIPMEENLDHLHEDLLRSLKNDTVEQFETIFRRILPAERTLNDYLKGRYFDWKKLSEEATAVTDMVNREYGAPEHGTLLDIACRDRGKAQHVISLIRLGADVNRINQHDGAAPIHTAILHSDYETVKALVEEEKTDIYQPNVEGKTAFHLAAQQGRKDCIELLQKRQAADIEKAKRKFWKHEDISETEELLETIPQGETLARFLYLDDYEKFERTANDKNVHNVDNDLKFTYLQYACKHGRIKFVQLLLSFKVDHNKTTESQTSTPITLAAYHGYYELVQLLLDTGTITFDIHSGENILHSIMHGFYTETRKRQSKKIDYKIEQLLAIRDDRAHQDYAQCLRLILNNVPVSELNVDLKDSQGNTPLFYAVIFDERDMILQLLERGAYIGVQAWNGYSIELIKLFQPATLQYFLEESTYIDSISPFDKMNSNYPRMKFNYNLLRYDQQNLRRERINETKPLVALSEVPELRPLLKHPFFLVYLDFKWHIIMRNLFNIYSLVFIAFVVCLSAYLMDMGNVFFENNKKLASACTALLAFVVFICNSIMFLKELIQFIVYTKTDKCRYIKDLNNWREIFLIAIVYVILLRETNLIQNTTILAALAILLSYLELMLLILSRPTVSEYFEMFKKVAWSSLNFLLSYLLLIVAFAFSFYVLFKGTNTNNINSNSTHSYNTNLGYINTNNTNSTQEFIKDISQGIFRTLLMSTGEYGFPDILGKDQYVVVAHLIFLLFVFLIPLVLLNLLNAIAVNDIQRIKKDAELVSVVARVRLIARMEEIISALFSFFSRLSPGSSDTQVRRRSQHGRHASTILDQYKNIYYYTNYFSTVGQQSRISLVSYEHCVIEEHRARSLKFPISPTTVRATQEKLSADAIKKEKLDKMARETSALYEVCENLLCLRNELEKTDKEYTFEEYQMFERILTVTTNLTRKKCFGIEESSSNV